MTSYTVEVYEKDGESYIDLPQEELESLGWTEGTELEWIDQGDGSWVLRKKENMDFVEKVVEFNRVAGTGEQFDKRKVALYYGLIMEELAEGIEALNCDREAFLVMRNFLNNWSLRFKEGDFDHHMDDMSRVDGLDAFVDLAVVALGGACAMGAKVNGACHEVMDSNLSKFPIVDGVRTVEKDANGKVKKAAGYRPPNLEPFV
jgi:bifunctional DNA-binding transcriptional regulator/antitoxin component of YhaV-PrlF toxin-antitoxin module